MLPPRKLVDDVVFIPTLPLPVINKIFACVGEPTRNSESIDAPLICSSADGKLVPIPTLPLPLIKKMDAAEGEDQLL